MTPGPRHRSATPIRASKSSTRAFQRWYSAMPRSSGSPTGCRFNEGPVWFGDGRFLLWSDIPNDRIMKWEEETGAVSLFRKPSHYANGNTRDRQGRLVTCEMDAQRLTRTEYDGTITVLADSFDGKRLTGAERRRRQVRWLDLVQRQRRRHARQLSRPYRAMGIAAARLPARSRHWRNDGCDRRHEAAERSRFFSRREIALCR